MKKLGALCAVAPALAGCADQPLVFLYRRVEQPELRVANTLVLRETRLACSPKLEITVQLPGVGPPRLVGCDRPDLELRPDEIESTRIHERASLLKPEDRYFSLSAQPKPDAWLFQRAKRRPAGAQ